jgi:hypothetical protein
MNSKVIQISTVFNAKNHITIITALCEDGTIWQLATQGWRQVLSK